MDTQVLKMQIKR